MAHTCCCKSISTYVDETTHFIRRRSLHPCVTVVESLEHGVELTISAEYFYRYRGESILFVPRQVYEVWRVADREECRRNASIGESALCCLQYSLFGCGLLFCWSGGVFCGWLGMEYVKVRRLDHFRRHHLPTGYRVEIARLPPECSSYCGVGSHYEQRMYVSQEAYEAAAEEDPVYQEWVREWEREQQNEQRRREQQRAQQERQQDRQLSRPEARQQLSSLRESTVEEVLISCDLNDEKLAYAQRFRQEGVTSVQLLCELTYEDLAFMRAGHRRRLFLYLHPQESITGALIKRASLVPPTSTTICATSSATST
mmetsp:Transcript_1156/g.3542  ORF Transcript_1156/g.3542 Transcript_1156/m.3542 type:complete len:314 (+) Transcript_1156:111-1052(+)|eukprot:CAMPEP_0177649930 /NCGR_PEP_ID=MMETSP0447-20121125/11659_1 /TAXON_ID=0 /ORGANISM="Stygamoeba regulata, Strain BSH-02190019" /LENGTH=313 /DNA_ID=CAMNT_0019152741 /DNA_START=104 /DNA_END=1041 /DNA_ORIENTATION=-